MANQNPLTLTHQQLYDLVWSKAVRDVAQDFGMSDVALAKRCRAVRVPIPPRGYWARVAAGQKPRKTPLPKHRSGKYTDGARESPPAEPTVTFPPRPTTVVGRLIVDGEPLQLRIDERQRQSAHVPTETEKADKMRGHYVWMPRFDYAPSGELRLHVTEPGHSYTEKVWRDTNAHPLELQVHKILHGLLGLTLERKRHREGQREREIAARELERQQAIIRQRRAANVKLIEELEHQAGAWHRARFLRRYLRAAKRALGDRSFTTDLHHERSFQYGADEERLKGELQRLLGHSWETAAKVVTVLEDAARP